jgi:addiction module HigA family antidote
MITIHPGEYIKIAYLEDGIETQAELARKLGISYGGMSRIIAGKMGVSARMALKLEEILGRSAESWLALQTTHDLAMARRERILETGKLEVK